MGEVEEVLGWGEPFPGKGVSRELVGEDIVGHEAASFQAPPLSVHQGEAGLMTAPAIVRGSQEGVSYFVTLEMAVGGGSSVSAPVIAPPQHFRSNFRSLGVARSNSA